MKNQEKQEALKYVDPVCGMSVNPDLAEKTTYMGETFYFCSQDCEDKFLAQPSEYASSVISR